MSWFAAQRLANEHPGGLQQRESDQAEACGRSDQGGIIDLETKQQAQADDADRRRQPIADRDLTEQDGGPEDRSDRRGIGAFDKALHMRIVAVSPEQRRDNEDQQK